MEKSTGEFALLQVGRVISSEETNKEELLERTFRKSIDAMESSAMSSFLVCFATDLQFDKF